MGRVTGVMRDVLCLMASTPSSPMYGLELVKATGHKSGTLYPALARMEQAGLVVGEWELVDPAEAERPRRRYYRLTAVGEREASTERERRIRVLGLRPGPAL